MSNFKDCNSFILLCNFTVVFHLLVILGSAKPSNLRAKFENFAKVKEEEDSKRMAEQKRLREEKDRLDREEALKAQQNGKEHEKHEIDKQHQPRTSIDTGRTSGIGNAISMFNKVEEKPIVPAQRVSPFTE